MSSDPKKPFDAPPATTPELLQKEMNLDRRKRVPSFDELNTDPERPAVRAPAAAPPRPAPAPGADDAPTTRVPPGLAPRSPAQAADQWNAEQAKLRAAAQARPPVPPASAPTVPAARPVPAPTSSSPTVPAVARPGAPLDPAAMQARAAAQAQAQAQARAAAAAAAQAQAQAQALARAQAQAAAQAPQRGPMDEEQDEVPTRVGELTPAQASLMAQARAQAQAAALARSQALAQAQAHAEAQAQAQARAQAVAQAEAQARGQAETQARSQAETQARSQAELQARMQGEAQARAQAQAEAQARAQAQAAAQARAQAEANARAQAEANARAQAEANARAQARSQAETAASHHALTQAHAATPLTPTLSPSGEREALAMGGRPTPQEEVATRTMAAHRPAPPSPGDFAQARAAVPQVTPVRPTQGAVVPEGGLSPSFMQKQTAELPARVQHDEPEPHTVPAAPNPARSFTPSPAPVHAPAPLPAEMLVTQPGLPGPFAHARALPGAPQPLPMTMDQPALLPGDSPAFDEQPTFDDPRAGQGGTVTAEPASLWRRTGAWLADLTFVAGLVLGFLFVAMQVIAPKNLSLLQQLTAIALPGAGLAVLLAFVYTTLFAFLWNGRTPGRRMFGIHLVDTTGHAPAPFRALVRAMLSLVSFGLFLSGFWLALFDRHGQTLHDKLTRTFVVKLQDA